MFRSKRIVVGAILNLTAVTLLAGCSSARVQICDNEILARPEMQLNHRAHDLEIDDHIYFSKEAASGGRGFGGGGCGCN